jgi:hypothetical protein
MRDIRTFSQFNFCFQGFSIKFFSWIFNISHIKELNIMSIILDIVKASSKYVTIIWRWRETPQLRIPIIECEYCLLIYTIRILWIVNQVNLIFLLEWVRSYKEPVIIHVGHHCAHAPRLKHDCCVGLTNRFSGKL